MTRHVREKQERIVEAVRQGLEGEDAVRFIHESGFAMSPSGIARHLRTLGGRGFIRDLVDEGKSNEEILAVCVPDIKAERPSGAHESNDTADDWSGKPLYDTTKISVKLPSEVYEAIRLAAKAERKTQSQMIVELLTRALSDRPRPGID